MGWSKSYDAGESMSEIIIDGTRYLPERPVTAKQLPFNVLIGIARRYKNETLEQAALGIGTTKSNLHALEHGRSVPRLPLLQRILSYYGIAFDQIALSDG